MIRSSIIAATLALCPAGQLYAQDWKIPLGDGQFYLDTRTIKGSDVVKDAWVRAHKMSPEGIVNVEFHMQAACNVEVVATWRIVAWSHHSAHVVDERTPKSEIFQSAPFEDGLLKDFFAYLCD